MCANIIEVSDLFYAFLHSYLILIFNVLTFVPQILFES